MPQKSQLKPVTGKLFRFSPTELQEEPGFNLRDYGSPDVQAHISGFADSYAKGLHVPPLIIRLTQDNVPYIIEGHCRQRGALLALQRGANIAALDCYCFDGNDAERVQVMLRSAEGLKLKPLEVAFGYLRLHRMGHDNQSIADQVGKTTAHVEQLLLLAKANSDVHQLVRDGVVSAYTAIEAVRKYREQAGEFLGAKKRVDSSGRERVTRSAISRWLPPKKVMTVVLDGLDTVVGRIDTSVRSKLIELENTTAGSDPQNVNGKIEIDAALLSELLKLHEHVSTAREHSQERERQRSERAAQGSLDVTPGQEAGDE